MDPAHNRAKNVEVQNGGTYFNNIETHVDNMFSTSTIISSSRITLESVAEVSTLQIMIS